MKERAVLVDIIEPSTPLSESELRLNELESLVKTYGGVSALKTIQRKAKPDYQTYIGKGKITEILDDMEGAENIDVIILNNLLKPRQIYNLEEFCHKYEIDKQKEKGRFEVPKKIQVWDRVDLILKIFDKHADSAEAKLQIELASIKHMGPRIFGMGLELSRQAGGIGTVGIGETNTEIMKRYLQKRTKFIEDKITKYGDIQKRQRETRRKRDLKTVALAGYTNAGKSTLLKALTKKRDVYIADELFATLDSKVGELYFEHDFNAQSDSYQRGFKLMFADTIGFIQDLPPSLIQAFKTTLAEIVDADLIMHVIDINDKNLELKIQVVEEIINELGCKDIPKIYVFNKIDQLDHRFKNIDEAEKLDYLANITAKYSDFNPQLVSALDESSLTRLKDVLKTSAASEQ